MPYIEPEVVQRAKEMDLLTYLQNYEPQELVHFGGSTYCTREHDSLKISNGKWCWFSHGIGGKSALDYLIKVKGKTFIEAVEMITGRVAAKSPVFVSQKVNEKPKQVLLPPTNHCATHAVVYLKRRGIDDELISFCMSTGRFYESYPYHNAVFVGLDKAGHARYANMRGIGTDFKGEANGSDKRYSFSIPAAKSETLYLFESAIDLLSFATERKLDGKAWNTDHLLSLAGVYKPKKEIRESTIPLALTRYLSDYPEVRVINLCLDNDIAGRIAAQTLKEVLPEKYDVCYAFPKHGKDYNDQLCIRLCIPITKIMERNEAR